MAQLRISEAELARDLSAILDKVRGGSEIVIEQNKRPVAILKSWPRTGRPITECIALAKAGASGSVMDDEFARDVEEAVRSHNGPWNPPSWD